MSRNYGCCPDHHRLGKLLQLRVIHGYSKVPVAGDLYSFVGTGGAFDGVIINFDPALKYETAAYDTFQDAIGNTMGVPDPTGNIARETIHVVSDRVTNMTAQAAAIGPVPRHCSMRQNSIKVVYI